MQKTIVYIFMTILLGCVFNGCAQTSLKLEKLYKDDRAESRIEYLKNNLKADPYDVNARMELGKTYLTEGKVEEAIIQFTRVLSIDSNQTQAYLLLSSAIQMRSTYDLKKVLALLKKASQISPDNSDVHLNLAQVYVKLREERKAINEFKTTIELSDHSATLVSAHLGLMAIYKRRGDSIKANEEYEKALKIDSGAVEILMQDITQVSKNEGDASEKLKEKKEDGFHPSHEERIIRAQEEIRKLSGSER